MIISYARRFVFVHIPKTGGTSLALALEDKAKKDDILIGDTPKAKRRKGRLKDVETNGRLWKHSRLADVYGLLTQDQMEDYFIFTLVRNPWDRIVSYYHWLKVQDFTHPAVKWAQEMTFSEFLNFRANILMLQGDRSDGYAKDNSGIDRCDAYVRLEHFQEDIRPFETHSGMKIGPLQRTNTSARAAEYRSHYSEKDRDLIARIFASDIHRSGYTFED